MTENLKTSRVQLVTSPKFIADVDAWRCEQPDLPSRSEAIRRLVAMDLDSTHRLQARSSDA
ncbi:hypothetical protein SXCC_00421 [Gluconacetobacter sp. SXCC-1]|nr:hypothetical protein SXCC_00421 [Gluconacetobacter sp. SXCC-1]